MLGQELITTIATEAKVVQKLSSEGIKKSDLTREEFLNHDLNGKRTMVGIPEQLKN